MVVTSGSQNTKTCLSYLMILNFLLLNFFIIMMRMRHLTLSPLTTQRVLYKEPRTTTTEYPAPSDQCPSWLTASSDHRRRVPALVHAAGCGMHRVNAHRHLHIRLEPAGIPLVRNIGFGADATHTKEPDAYSSVGAEELDKHLTH